jgi:hypothetical protein
MWSIGFQPLLPLPWLLGLGLAALLAAGLSLLTGKRAVAWLRALALAALVVALADPSFIREERDPLKDVVAVVVDRSASQGIDGRMEQTQAALSAVKRKLDAMPGVETRVIEVGAQDTGDDGTRLFAGLRDGLADVPSNRIAGVIVLSDGIVHDVPGSIDALPFRAPLHALITGRLRERDRRIELIEAPKFGIVGKDQAIRARINDTGGSQPATLSVKRDGTEIARLPAAIGQTIRIPVRIEHGGPNIIELEVAAVPGELTAANNRAVVTIEGVRDKLRVLLVSGEPHAGERTWRNLLKSDANVELVHFTILRPPEKQDGTPINELSLIAFPTRELFSEKIKDFDLIIFDRYSNQSILPRPYFENITRYVREGGAVMIAAGPEYAGSQSLYGTPLGQIIPARPDGAMIQRPFLARLTDLGRRHPVTRDLPGANSEPPTWSQWLRQISSEVRSGTTIMNGADGKPLVVLSREEKGRVAVMLSDHAWLWARNYQNGGPHLEMLRRISHWLMKEPQLEEEALRGFAKGNRITIERQSMAQAIDPITLTLPSGALRTITLQQTEPGRFTADIDTPELGLHRLSSGNLIAFVGVGPDNPREWRDLLSDLERLKPLAEATGGSVRRLASADGSLSIPTILALHGASRYSTSDTIGLRATDQYIVRGIGLWPVFAGLAGLLLISSLLIGAWVAEGGRRQK